MKQNNDNERVLLRDLADYLPGVVFRVTVDLDGKLHPAFVCKEAEQLVGFGPHEIERNPSRLFELVPAEQRKEISELLSKSRKADQKIKKEIRIRRPNGDKRWLRIEARPRPLPDNNGYEWFGVAVDVTEVRKREWELEKSRALTKSIVASVDDAIFVIGPPHRQVIQSANAAVEKIFGYSPEELEGQTTEILHENQESYEVFGRATERVLETHKSFRGEYRMRRKNGEVFSTEHVITVMHPEAGWQVGVVSVVRDITERKRMELALGEHEHLFREVFDHMSTCAAIYDSPDNGQSFIFKDMNRAGIECGRKTKEEVVGRDVREVFPGVEAMGLFDVFQRVWHTGIPEELPSTEYKDELLKLWIDNYVCRLPSGKLLSIYEDTTDRKLAEEEKENLVQQVQRVQKMEAIGNLAGGIAHDFNNLLSPIIGLSELLLEDLPAGGFHKEKVEDILKAAKRSSDLVKHILAFSRQAEIKDIPVRLQVIMKEVIRLSRSTIPSYIEIIDDLQEDCGKVIADPTRIHQIVMNLITNAYHAVEPENGRILISLEETTVERNTSPIITLPPGQYARLTVSDTGIGIDPSILDKLFEPYFTTKEKGKGTGLGLAVAYGIVKDHGGDIKVSSELGKGSSFQVYLPVAAGSETSTVSEPVHPEYTGAERILLVDDEEMIVKMVKQMLMRIGYEVREYTRSLDALEAFAGNPEGFDLVITDMAMPNLSGDLLARKILDIRGDIPVILCTGFSERITPAIAADMGISDVLMKPIVKNTMARVIREALDKEAPSE